MGIADFISDLKYESRRKSILKRIDREEKIKELNLEIEAREKEEKIRKAYQEKKQALRQLKTASIKEKFEPAKKGLSKGLTALKTTAQYVKGSKERMKKSPFFNSTQENNFFTNNKQNKKTEEKTKPKRVKIIEY